MTRALVLKSPGYAGLGDLLLALDLALLVARVSGRTLVVDWRDTPYSRGKCDLAEQLFSLKGIEHLPPAVLANASGAVEPVAWQEQLDQPLRQLYGGLRSDNWNRTWASTHLDAGQDALGSDAPWVVLWDHSAPALQAEALRRLGAPAPPPLLKQLHLHPALQEAISTFQRMHFRQPMIGVHLRASAEAVRAGKSADLGQMCEQIDQLLKANPASGLFLASDNAASIAAMQARYPRVLTRPKWLPDADAPLHLSEEAQASGIAIASDALIELALLAACDQLIHPALSSFSLAAARWAGMTPHQLFPIQSPTLSPDTSIKALAPFMKLTDSLKARYRRIRYAHSCSVCGGSFQAFEPIDPKYQKELTDCNSDLILDQFETLNTTQYACPLCGTADRNRLAALALARLNPNDPKFALLDIAPSGSLSAHIRKTYPCLYTTADIDMPSVDARLDIQDMPAYADSSLNGILCSHVLEHVDNDLLALNEFHRVLAPGGWALLSVPIYRAVESTHEEGLEKLSSEERCRRFGQSDHVRLYEKDSFIARVESAGFRVKRLDVNTFGEKIFKRYGISATSAIYHCLKAYG